MCKEEEKNTVMERKQQTVTMLHVTVLNRVYTGMGRVNKVLLAKTGEMQLLLTSKLSCLHAVPSQLPAGKPAL